MTTKKCPYCQAFFVPTRRGGKGQKVCGKPSCKKTLKAENNARWRRDNPHYWRNDYPRIKRWLDQHPGYLKQYRADHPDYVQNNREAQRKRDRRRRVYLDIQAQIKDQLPGITKQLDHLPFLDIQDLKSPKPLEMTFLLRTFPCLDIQIQIAKSIALEQNRIIQTGG
jgi:hypothetical protein